MSKNSGSWFRRFSRVKVSRTRRRAKFEQMERRRLLAAEITIASQPPWSSNDHLQVLLATQTLPGPQDLSLELHGPQTFNGNSPFTGTTVVSGGRVTGSGTLAGPLLVGGAATLAPGNSPGILSTGDFTLDPGTDLEIEIGGTVPGNTINDHDQVDVTGSVTLAGNLITLPFNGFLPIAGDQFRIIENDAADAVNGNFAGLPEGAVISDFIGSGLNAWITYQGGDGNDVVLEVFNPTIEVTNTNDSGPGSLRQAILDSEAQSGFNEIDFHPAVTGTITLSSGMLSISDAVLITGPGAGLLTIQSDGSERVLNIGAFGQVTVEGLSFSGSGSSIESFGGVIHNLGLLTLRNSIVTDGVSFVEGGGIWNGGALSIENTSITNNSSSDGGGIYNADAGATFILVNSTVSGNVALQHGGGIYHFDGAVTIGNSTISGNAASFGEGGGLYSLSSVSMSSSTIAANVADIGGGISVASGSLSIINTLVGENIASTAGPDVAGDVSSGGFNLIADPSGSTGFGSLGDLLITVTLIGPLSDNGGPTQTHALLPGSPAIDAGSTLGAFDQRGLPRDASPDIGAFEQQPTIFIVTNTNDSGAGSLRQAMLDAASELGLNEIQFEIPGPGPHTISLLSALPTIVDPVVIDGSSEPDFIDAPVIEVTRGGGSFSGLVFDPGSEGSEVRGLSLTGFTGVSRAAIVVIADGITVAGNWIGISPDLVANGNQDGIRVRASDALIGGSGSLDANVIVGSLFSGILIEEVNSENNRVFGNIIGTDPTGTSVIANQTGVTLDNGASNNFIGTDGDGLNDELEGNLISGSTGSGEIHLRRSGTDGNVIAGNRIGTDLAGEVALGTNSNGVFMTGGVSNTRIGGTLAAESNLISGNSHGISIVSLTAGGTTVIQGNRIGTNATGDAILENSGSGILLSSAGLIQIGGGLPEQGNLISGNFNHGVFISGSGTAATIEGNSIGTDSTGSVPVANNLDGIRILNSAEHIVRGNVLSGNGAAGIFLNNANDNQIRGNIIGASATGTTAVANAFDGIWIQQSDDNVIGGNLPGQGNLISGNTLSGVLVDESSDNVIVGNLIGVDANGSTGLANGNNGILVTNGSENTVIGGTTAGAGNVISGNINHGILIENFLPGLFTTGTLLQGNLIGVNSDGDAAIANGDTGVTIHGADGNTIGGPFAAARNIISGNINYGIAITSGATDNVIQGNYIGSNRDGDAAIPNANGFLLSDSASSNLIGTDGDGVDDSAEGNLVSGNTANGILVFGSDGNKIAGNLIGLDATGTSSLPNLDGIAMFVSSNNIVGTDSSADAFNANERNYISGNLDRGVVLEGANVVSGNWIGLGIDGEIVSNLFGVQVTETGARVGTNSDGIADDQERNVIAGNSIAGISVRNGTTRGAIIAGNYIGTDPTGLLARPNATGIRIGFAANLNIIGGDSGNVISGNSIGIEIAESGTINNAVLGNYIGVGADGLSVVPNFTGILIQTGASSNDIGGDTAGARNIISGNFGNGIEVIGFGTNHNAITGNFIGTDVSGNLPRGNANGIRVGDAAVGTTIGGATALAGSGRGNLISGNSVAGIRLENSVGSENVVVGNMIGLAVDGDTPIPNNVGIFSRSDLSVAGAFGTLIGGTDAALRNVVSGNASIGIQLSHSGSDLDMNIQGNYIGTNRAGDTAVGNASDGIAVGSAPGTIIGGDSAGAGNLISGNRIGITISGISHPALDGAYSVFVRGNWVGLNASGDAPIPNFDGIYVINGSNLIGTDGNQVNDGLELNVISGNLNSGITIAGANADSNVVAGNRVGVNVAGTVALGNNRGIVVDIGADGNTIGGTGAEQGNLVSGNRQSGIILLGGNSNEVLSNLIGTDHSGTLAIGNSLGSDNDGGVTINGAQNTLIGGAGSGNVIASGQGIAGGGIVILDGDGTSVRGNFIGTDRGGTIDFGNHNAGIFASDTVTIGGSIVGQGNTIANNRVGVIVSSAAAAVSIQGNSIRDNDQLGIDLNDDGVTANDPLDADIGGNALQNYPVLDAVAFTGTTTVEGSFAGTSNSGFFLDFYASGAPDPSGFGEGARHLGSMFVVTDGSGVIVFSATGLDAVFRGEYVTATATDTIGNTSEFSNSLEATFTTPPTIVDGSLIVTVVSEDDEEATYGIPTLDINEGQTLYLTGDFADADSNVHVEVTWGDGRTSAADTIRQESFTASHVFLDDNPTATPADEYGILVRVVDADGSGTALITVQVHNVDPVINETTLSAVVIDEGQAVTVSGSFDDPGSGDQHTLTIDWGDSGGLQTVIVPSGERTFSVQHVYTRPGSFPIGYSLVDDDRDPSLPQPTDPDFVFDVIDEVFVRDLPPSATILVPSSVLEGDRVPISASVVLAGDDALKFEWVITVDGTEVFSSTKPSFEFIPSQSGNHSIRLLLSDGSLSSLVTSGFNVGNALPSIDPADITIRAGGNAVTSVIEGATVSLSGLFDDQSPSDIHQVTVDFGDGSSPQTYFAEAGSRKLPTFTHTYLDDPKNANDTFVIKVSVDDGSDAAQAFLSLEVLNSAPEVTFAGSSISLSQLALTASVADAGILDTHEFQWLVDGELVATTPGLDIPRPAGNIADILLRVRDNDGEVTEVSSFVVLPIEIDNPNTVTVTSESSGNIEVRIDGQTPLVRAVPQQLFLLTGDSEDTVTIITQPGAVPVNTRVDLGAGNDTIQSAEGNDTVVGGPGDDVIQTGGGDDTLISDEGNDVLDGGLDDDEYVFVLFSDKILVDVGGIDTLNFDAVPQGTGLSNGVTLNLGLTESQQQVYQSSTSVGTITLRGNFENVIGSKHNDALTGNVERNRLFGGSGDDSLASSGGDDSLAGGDGADTIDGSLGSNDSIFGGPGDDSIVSGGGDDSIDAGDGNDVIVGGGHNDSIFGGPGDDSIVSGGGDSSIVGGDGNDTIAGAGGQNDSIFGGPGDDSLVGSGSDTIAGGDGNDTIVGSAQGDDSLSGGIGNDTIVGGGGTNDSIFGGPGDDSIVSGDGEDSIVGTGGVIDGGDGDDTISGNTSNDSIFGGPGDDSIVSGAGDNTIDGGSGNDVIIGGSDSITGTGSDSIFGGPGDDSIIAGSADETINGGSGTDTIVAGDSGSDSIFGGPGDDSIVGSGGDDTIDGGSGDDIINGGGRDESILGGIGDDTITGGSGGNDSIFGGPGDDSIVGGGGDTIDGGDGDDTILGSGSNDSIFGGPGDDSIVGGGGDSGIDEEVIHGGDGNDTIIGGGSDDSIFGGPGDDSIVGGGGDPDPTNGTDTIDGGSGDDTIIGGTENDSIFGGPGDDSIRGGGGDDTVNAGSGDDTIISGGNDSIFGGPGDDSILGSGVNDTLVGGEGSDTILGGNGSGESINGGGGNDVLIGGGGVGDSIFGGPGDDSIVGSDGDDTIIASGDETIHGGDGDDTIVGGSGSSDSIFGGSGDDSIVGGSAGVSVVSNNHDTILGGDGDDTIVGGNSDDSIFGGPGDDSIAGGGGDDTISGGDGNDSIIGGSGGGELIDGGSGDDTIASGGGSNDSIFGSAGNDVILIDGEAIKVFGDAPGSTAILEDHHAGDRVIVRADADITISSNTGGDVSQIFVNGIAVADLRQIRSVSLFGGESDNVLDARQFTGDAFLFGLGGHDSLWGGSGNDVLEGGLGNDVADGGPGRDRYWFSGSADLGLDVLSESVSADDDVLDFFGMGRPVQVDLTRSDVQQIAPGLLALRLIDPNLFEDVVGTVFSDKLYGNTADNRLVGGGGADFVYGAQGDDYLTATRTRFVYLDFDSQTSGGDHIYLPSERNAIEARMRADYAAFDVQFSQVRPASETYVTVLFNSKPVINGREVSGGVSDRIGFRDVVRGGFVQVDVNDFLGNGRNQLPPEERNFVALSSTIASHELGHVYGLRHQDAFGAPNQGIFAALRDTAFLPIFTGPRDADETPNHLISSPASVRTTLSDALADPYFGEREAFKLAFGETGASTFEDPAAKSTLPAFAFPIQPLGALLDVAVPNTIQNPQADHFGTPLDASALHVIGDIERVNGISENDLYSFTASADDVITFEIFSFALRTRITNTIDSLIRVYDINGQILEYHNDDQRNPLGAFNDDGFEPTDSVLIDLRIPADGTYVVEVDTFNFAIPEFSHYVPGFDVDGFCGNRVGDIRCDDTDTGQYELLIYQIRPGETGAFGDVLIGGEGDDTLISSSGFDSFLAEHNDSFGGPGQAEALVFNQPPVLDPIGSQVILENSVVQFTAFGRDLDPFDEVRYSLAPLAGGVFPDGALIDPITGQFEWLAADDGSFDFEVVVTDLTGVSSSQPVSIAVANADLQVSIVSVTGELIAGSPVTIAVQASDPAGIHGTIQWTYQVLDGSTPVFTSISTQPEFSFTPTDSGEFVVRVTALGLQSQQVASVSTTVVVESAAVPLTVTDVILNGGQDQRSQVRSVEVVFSEATNLQALIDGGAIGQVIQIVSSGGVAVNLSGRLSYDLATSKLVIDLRQTGTENSILADGSYQLRLHSNGIHSLGNPENLLLDDDGTSDGIRRSGFHQLKNDFNGDGLYGAPDNDAFFARIGSVLGDSLFDSVFDLDGNDVIDSVDYSLWRNSLRTVGRRTR